MGVLPIASGCAAYCQWECCLLSVNVLPIASGCAVVLLPVCVKALDQLLHCTGRAAVQNTQGPWCLSCTRSTLQVLQSIMYTYLHQRNNPSSTVYQHNGAEASSHFRCVA